MSRTIFIYVFAFFITFNFFQSTLQSVPPKALNEERLQVLKEALTWMTFRKNGDLLNEQDLEPYFEVLKQRYRESKYYRTLIVAFKQGVYPKLTLQMNDACDPAYPLEYRESLNNSVTDGLLKRFIFKSYDKRGDQSRQFCDYRQGLVCNTQTKKCECPEGSKMGPISAGSAVQRCLVQENEICSLIDLDHDPTSKYGALKKLLPVMIFNLEKPLSCKLGTQCRFKATSDDVPLCYLNNGGPWDKGSWQLDIGTECTIGLYGDIGQCLPKKSHSNLGVHPQYTCYNFGPRSRTRSPKVGLCAHDSGSYGISNSISPWDPVFIAFVSPATTPLRGWKLHDYYEDYLDKVFGPFVTYSWMAKEDERCNIAKTEKFLELWKFFQSLEGTPPQGQDYVATEAVLKDKLQQVVDLTIDSSKIPCRVYTHKKIYGAHTNIRPAYQCITQAPTDADGNDGTCKQTPEKDDVTNDFANKFQKYEQLVEDVRREERRQEDDYRRDLIELVELECDPKLGPPPGSAGAPPSTDNDVLEDGYCPPDRGCHEDYGDYQGIYYSNCGLKNSNQKFYRNCQSLDESRGLGPCEKVYLENRVKNDLERLPSYSRLGRGDECDYSFETKIRFGNFESNLYRMLIKLRGIQNGMAGNKGICDRTRLLECAKNGTCQCLERTAPRKVTFQGKEYTSDYCYVTSGGCENIDSIYERKSVESEKQTIDTHYKGSYWDCDGSNWCVFYLEKGRVKECTTENTGSTGLEPLPKPKPVVVNPQKPPCYSDKCGYQEAGGAEKKSDLVIKMIILIEMINFVG